MIIKVGDKVAHKFSNKYGTIEDMWWEANTFKVKIEMFFQDGFQYCFYEDELVLIKEKENIEMAKLTGYKQVAAIKQGCSIYYYAIFDDGRVYCPGDKVIVSGAASGTVHTISEIIDAEEAANRMGKKNITAEVIGYVDTSAYDDRVAKRKEAEELKKKMDHIIKEMDENNRYEMYAERNPILKEMLETYKKLTV